MKRDVLTQVRAYFEDLDAGLPPIDPADAAGGRAVRTDHGRGGRIPAVRPLKVVRPWRGPLVAGAAAVLVLAVFGAVFLLQSPSGDAPVADTSQTTAATTVPSTAAPATTAVTTPPPTTAAASAPAMEWRQYPAPARLAAVAMADSVVAAVGSASDGYSSDAAVCVAWQGTGEPGWSDGWWGIADPSAFSGPGEGLEDGYQEMRDVAALGDGFVAVGAADKEDAGPAAFEVETAAVWLSPDGSVWERVPHQPALENPGGSLQMNGVAAGGPGLVAVGDEFMSEPWQFGPAVWVSSDGRSWERIPQDRLPDDGVVLKDVTSDGSEIYAVGTYEGGEAVVWRSADGTRWEAVAAPCPGCDEGGWSVAQFGLGSGWGAGMKAVAVSEHGVAAVGMIDEEGERPVAAVWVSQDGLAWDLAATFDPPDRLYDVMALDVVWDQDRIVVTGQERSDTGRFRGIVWVSPDAGTTWFEVARAVIVTPEFSYGARRQGWSDEPESVMSGVAVVDGGVVVVGDGGYSWFGRWTEN